MKPIEPDHHGSIEPSTLLLLFVAVAAAVSAAVFLAVAQALFS